MRDKELTQIYRVAIIVILILNIILFARILGVIYFPGELTPLNKAKQGAQAAIGYIENLAASYQVNKQKPVIDILARFKYEIEKSDQVEEVTSLMLDYGRQTQDIIFRAAQDRVIDQIITIINKQSLPESGRLTITRVDDQLKLIDPEEIITEKTKNELNEIANIPFNQSFDIKITSQRAEVLTSGDIYNQVDFLYTKVASLQRQLKLLEQKTGYREMTGSGIIINLYDNGNYEDIGIVHDSDIRNIINELWIAGARGIELGGQRLIINSAIRCVGPTILVNNKPIPVNPVTIKATGNRDVLASSLDIIKNKLNSFGIKLKIEKKDTITLTGQRGE